MPDFDDSHGARPAQAASGLQPAVPLSDVAAAATSVEGPLTLMAQGTLVERFGYENDDPAARFALRALSPSVAATAGGGLDYGPPQGRWWRYDAGHCRLLRPVIKLTATAGMTIEVAYCQALIDGKASPFHPLCGSASCYIDRYVVGPSVGGKPITLTPLEPRGCRYVVSRRRSIPGPRGSNPLLLPYACACQVRDTSFDDRPSSLQEVHVLQDDDATASVELTAARALFRGYYQTAAGGSWACPSDALLQRVWETGLRTTEACIEDSPIDGPCRERGQWTGDTLAVTLPNLVYCHDDLRPAKLTLMQTSAAADAHGVVSGVCAPVAHTASRARLPVHVSNTFRFINRSWSPDSALGNCPEGGAIADYALIWFEGLRTYLRAGSLGFSSKIRAARARPHAIQYNFDVQSRALCSQVATFEHH